MCSGLSIDLKNVGEDLVSSSSKLVSDDKTVGVVFFSSFS